MDRLRAMETFVRVVETGSFTLAARSMRLPRTTATTQIQGLEAHVGVRLLHRTTRRVTLTSEGALYYDEVRTLLRELAELEANLGREIASARGRIRVDLPATVGRHLVAPALPTFLAHHPEITIELGSTDRPVDLVAEGVDCVVRGGDMHDDSLVGRALPDVPVVSCAAPDYLARRGTPCTPDDLDGHLFVSFFSSKTGRVFEADWVRPDDGSTIVRAVPHAVAASDANTWLALAVAGLGIAQAPVGPEVRDRLSRGELRLIMPGWRSAPLPRKVLYPAGRHLPARVRLFIDWLVALFGAEDAAATAFLDAAEAEARALIDDAGIAAGAGRPRRPRRAQSRPGAGRR